MRGAAAHPSAAAFLAYMYLLEPATAVRVAFADGTCNPVAQVGLEPRRWTCQLPRPTVSYAASYTAS
jgi:hypothetical protein